MEATPTPRKFKLPIAVVTSLNLYDNAAMTAGVHIDLDGAWNGPKLGLRTVDARPLGPFLRYTAPQKQIEKAFQVFKEGIRDDCFILYGSGDFHYLAPWWLRNAMQKEPG